MVSPATTRSDFASNAVLHQAADRTLRNRPVAGLLLGGAALFAFSIVVLFTFYRAGRFAYHDLTLISDVLVNTAYGRGVFLISDEGISHLSIHFTPLLFLVVPLFRLFDSQFLLIALDAVAVAVSCAFQVAIFLRVSNGVSADARLRRWAPYVFLLLAGWNSYSKSALQSAHYEVFFMPVASMTLWLLVRGSGAILTILAAVLALGVRQDAGLFLTFGALSLLFLPRGIVENRRRLATSIALLGGLSLAWLVLGMKVFMPMFGGSAESQAQRFWAAYGSTWGQVAMTLARHPSYVVHDVARSGVAPLTVALGLLPLASPAGFLVSLVPAVTLFTASDSAKYLLLWYNAAWVLPAVLVHGGVGLAYAVRWSAKGHPRPVRAIATVFVIAPVVLAAFPDPPRGGGDRFWPVRDPQLATPVAMQRVLESCPSVASIATDFDSIVFVPNHLPKYLLHHFEEGDLVLLNDNAGRLIGSGAATMAEVRARVEASGKYRLVLYWHEVRAYVKPGIKCR